MMKIIYFSLLPKKKGSGGIPDLRKLKEHNNPSQSSVLQWKKIFPRESFVAEILISFNS